MLGDFGDSLFAVSAFTCQIPDELGNGAAMWVTVVAHPGQLIELGAGAEPSHGGSTLRIDLDKECSELVDRPGLCLNQAAPMMHKDPDSFRMVVVDPAVPFASGDQSSNGGSVTSVGFAGTVTVTHHTGETSGDLTNLDTSLGEGGGDVPSVPGGGFNTSHVNAMEGGESSRTGPPGGGVWKMHRGNGSLEVIEERCVECVKMGIDTDHNHDLSSQIVQTG